MFLFKITNFHRCTFLFESNYIFFTACTLRGYQLSDMYTKYWINQNCVQYEGIGIFIPLNSIVKAIEFIGIQFIEKISQINNNYLLKHI